MSVDSTNSESASIVNPSVSDAEEEAGYYSSKEAPTEGAVHEVMSSASSCDNINEVVSQRTDSDADDTCLQNNDRASNRPWYATESLIKFVTPCSMSLIGMSGCGKTWYIKSLLEKTDGVFTEPPSRIVYCYNIYQQLFSEMSRTVKNISFYQGVPDRETIENWASSERHLMLVFDDLYSEIVQSKDICDLTIMLSHHLRISCLFTAHNIFMNSRYSKTIATNLHYILLLVLRNRTQLAVLGSQLFCHKAKSRNFVKVYDMVSESNNGDLGNPLIIDNSPVSQNKQFRLRSNVLPGQFPMVYQIN